MLKKFASKRLSIQFKKFNIFSQVSYFLPKEDHDPSFRFRLPRLLAQLENPDFRFRSRVKNFRLSGATLEQIFVTLVEIADAEAKKRDKERRWVRELKEYITVM